MNGKQKVMVVLLVIAILVSVTSILVNLTSNDFEKINSTSPGPVPETSSSGAFSLNVEGNSLPPSGGEI